MNNKELEEKKLKELEELQETKMAVVYELDGQQIKLTPKIVKEYIIGDPTIKISNQEFKMFSELCKVRGLNPFLREAYCIKYSNNTPATIVVGKDAILKRAVLNSKYNGMKSGIYVVNEDGEEKKRTGTFKLPGETLVGGWAEVYRKDWDYSIEASVSLEEATQRKNNGEPNSNWTKQPATMIEKVAKVRALREAFVEDLGGMYEAEEMNVEIPTVEEKIIQQEEPEEVEYIQTEPTQVKQVNINDL